MENLESRQRAGKPNSPDGAGIAHIMNISWGMAGTAALVAALDLEVFDKIEGGARSLEELTRRTGASARGLEGLLLGVSALGLVARDECGQYSLSDAASAHLVSGKPQYLGGLKHVYHGLNSRIWPKLLESVISGEPPRDLFQTDHAGNWAQVLPYLETLGCPAAHALASRVVREFGTSFRALDVGCGSGLYGRVLAQSASQALVVGLDREAVLVWARSKAQEAGVSDRVVYKSGDILSSEWGNEHHVVLLSNVLHGYVAKQARELVARAYESLLPGGALVINEFLPNATAPEQTPIQALFGLQMLLTSEGRAHFFSDYEAWAEDAGFHGLEAQSIAGPSTLLIARR